MYRQIYKRGGITEITPRQNYGLGKWVKKITKPISKIADKLIPNEVKSVLQKAAPVLGIASMATPFLGGATGFLGGIGSFLQKASPYLKLASATQALTRSEGKGLSLGDVAQLGALGYSAYKQGEIPGLKQGTTTPDQIQRISGGDFGQFKEPVYGAGDVLGGEMLGTKNVADTLTQSFSDKPGVLDTLKSVKDSIMQGSVGQAVGKTFEFLKENPDVVIPAYMLAGYLLTPEPQQPGESNEAFRQKMNQRKEQVRAYMKDYYSSYYKNKSPTEINQMIETDLSQYNYALGGRVGFQLGGFTPEEVEARKLQSMQEASARTPSTIGGRTPEIPQLNQSMAMEQMSPYDFPMINEGTKEPAWDYTLPGGINLKEEYQNYITSPTFEEMGMPPMTFEEFIAPQEMLYRSMMTPIPTSQDPNLMMYADYLKSSPENEMTFDEFLQKQFNYDSPQYFAQGGITNIPVRMNSAGIQELDYREKGGFVPPIGIKEKADDIPAMLSNNEFVFTAEAVKNAGKGDVNKGAEKMYTLMKTLENGGIV